jgi:predicted lactoylglutathione lyase
MSRMIFITLPVTDMLRARALYEALGFSITEKFAGPTCLFALSCESRAEVDAMTDAAIAAGGKSLHDAEDHGFMYSRAFEDPDGNGFGPMWMDPAAA